MQSVNFQKILDRGFDDAIMEYVIAQFIEFTQGPTLRNEIV